MQIGVDRSICATELSVSVWSIATSKIHIKKGSYFQSDFAKTRTNLFLYFSLLLLKPNFTFNHPRVKTKIMFITLWNQIQYNYFHIWQ